MEKETIYFDYIKSPLELTKEQAESCAHQGECDEDVTQMLKVPEIKEQFDKMDVDEIRKELKQSGAWDDEELKDDYENRKRLLWVYSGNLLDELKEREKEQDNEDVTETSCKIEESVNTDRTWINNQLKEAVEKGNSQLITYLLDKGSFMFKMNRQGFVDAGLVDAVKKSDMDGIRLYLDLGADVNTQADGKSLTEIATQIGQPNVIQILKDTGDLN